MATGRRISDMGPLPAFADADMLEIVHAGANYHVTWGAIKAAIEEQHPSFGYTPTSSYTIFRTVTATSATAHAGNAMRAFRMTVLAKVKVQLAVNVTALGAAGKHTAALYSVTADNAPGNKVYDFGELDTSSTGLKLGAELTIQPGEYFMVYNQSVTFTATSATCTNDASQGSSFATTGIRGVMTATSTYAYPLPASAAALGLAWVITLPVPCTFLQVKP